MNKKVIWRSPSNIAIVKYWGKKGNQIGINPSISFSLSESYTETEIRYIEKKSKGISMKFYFESQRKADFEDRISKYFHSIKNDFRLFEKYHLEIHSKNTFPHSAGIASSASAMSSLALGLVSIEKESGFISEDGFYRKSSHYSRLASGSAARSVYGGFTLWGKLNSIEASSDEYAIPLSTEIHPVFQNLHDSILMIKADKKEVSSTTGHKLMDQHPFKEARILQATNHCKELMKVLNQGNFNRFTEICELEALSLHGLMMNSKPSFILMEAETLAAIKKIRNFRKISGSKLCFTLDAGPNIHLIYPDEEKEKVQQFIREELLVYCKDKKWIDDRIGNGPLSVG